MIDNLILKGYNKIGYFFNRLRQRKDFVMDISKKVRNQIYYGIKRCLLFCDNRRGLFELSTPIEKKDPIIDFILAPSKGGIYRKLCKMFFLPAYHPSFGKWDGASSVLMRGQIEYNTRAISRAPRDVRY